MAPTYKDLAKTWLSNWPASVRGAPITCVCVHTRRNSGRVQVWKGAQTVSPDRYTLDVTHYTESQHCPGIRAFLPESDTPSFPLNRSFRSPRLVIAEKERKIA